MSGLQRKNKDAGKGQVTKEDALKKPIRELLALCRALRITTNQLESVGIVLDSLDGLQDQITEIIWGRCDITLTPEHNVDDFHYLIIDFSNGEFDIEDCLEHLALFAAGTH